MAEMAVIEAEGGRSKNKLKYMTRLRAILADSDCRGRVVPISELCRRIGITRRTFTLNIGHFDLATAWFAENQDAPLDAKAHYKGMLDAAMAESNAEIAIEHSSAERGQPTEIQFIEKTVEKKYVQRLTSRSKQVPELRVITTTDEREVQQVEPEEKIIERIREAYVMASVAEMPNIEVLIKDLGIVETPTLNAQTVRAVATKQNWKMQRAAHLYESLDLVPEEIQITSLLRKIQIQEMLYKHMKLVDRQLTQYALHGEVKSLDGMTTIPPPHPGTLPAYAIALRYFAREQNEIKEELAQLTKNPITKEDWVWIERTRGIRAMSHEELKVEIKRLADLSYVLEKPERPPPEMLLDRAD
jgi:hypothetical protein